jgi:hypothetical protein
MTDNQGQRQPAITAVRISGFATAVLLFIEFGLGTGLNLYVSVPTNKAFFSTVFGQAALATHVIIALLLILAALNTLIRSMRARRGFLWSMLGLVAILVAFLGGTSFVRTGTASASMTMAVATAVAMLAYLVMVFTLPGTGDDRA